MIRLNDHIFTEADGGVGYITLSNPDRRNAISLIMWDGIVAAVDRNETDPSVRVIVIRGANGTFISGADISEFAKNRASPEAVAAYDEVVDRSVRRIGECSKPTVAAIQSFCIGAGVAVALACDLRIASENAVFGVPAARLGLGYNWTDVKKLTDAIGAVSAKEVLLTARRFSSAEAYHMKLVHQVVPDAEHESHVARYCSQIARNAPLSMEAAKRTISELLKPSREIDEDYCRKLTAKCAASADYAEGFQAFMEKRNPVFKGC